ncbi:barstar family protein [Streptomyces sp. NBC_01214]|uniref:barstar family protein n=1 Tax=Streptomyces sp. NBC_01214 TaxID=2903777 RepID=UPI0022515183|nr:barstar family protein [Streptomyces sp. NBC_01214]MCX4808611.1 barstar family protein [Streptomyces sp. NBC_01214]
MQSEEHVGWERDFPVRYLLVRDDISGEEEGVLWGRCAEVEGLFMDAPPLPREVLTLRGCPRESLLVQAVADSAQPVQLLGDGMLSIEPVDPSNDGPALFWDLEDTAVLAQWPTPGDPGRVDVVVGTGVREEDYWGSKRLPSSPRFDLWFPSIRGDSPSGSCRSIDGLFTPRPQRPTQPVHLIGCEPAAPLLALLCRSLPQKGAPITLRPLDRHGRTMTRYRLDLDTVEARPSVLGGALIDVTITDPGDDRPTLAARQVWEIWSDGVPTLPNQWAQFDAKGQSEWLDLTRVDPYEPEGLSGGTYHLDGQHVTDRTSMLLALGEALLGPGANYGRCLDSVQDYLGGGPSVVPPFTLVWHHADIARQALAGHVMHHLGGRSYFEVTVDLLRKRGVTVVLQ